MTADNDMGQETQAIPHRPAFWVAVVGLSQVWKFLISIISSVVLGRLLAPNDFGLVATISPLVAMADLLRDLGFTQAVIQRKEISKGQVNALFWLSLGVTFLIAIFLSVISPLVASFFKEPRLNALLIATSWALVLGTLSALPLAWLNRNLRFATIAVIEALSTGIGFASAATCAWLTHSYWSLVLAGVAYSVTTAALALATSGWRPGLPSFDRVVTEMVRFGAGVSVANIANFVARNADNLLIAKADGPVSLGLYDRSYKLMLVPLSQITWPISRVLTPVLSKQVDQPEDYRKTYFSSISYLMTCAQPGVLFSVVFAQQVIDLLLGPRWHEVAPIFSWLGAAALQQLVTSSIVWLFISQGRAAQYATLGVTNSLIAVLSFVVGLPWGPLGVAVSFTVFDFCIRTPFSWWYATRQGPVGLAATTKTIVPHVVAVVLCATCLSVVARHVDTLTFPGTVLGALFTYALYIMVLSAWPSKRELLSVCVQAGLKQTRRYVSKVRTNRYLTKSNRSEE